MALPFILPEHKLKKNDTAAQKLYKKQKETYSDVMYRRRIERVPGEQASTGTEGVLVKIEKNTKKSTSFLRQLVEFFTKSERKDALAHDFDVEAADDNKEFQNKFLNALDKNGVTPEITKPAPESKGLIGSVLEVAGEGLEAVGGIGAVLAGIGGLAAGVIIGGLLKKIKDPWDKIKKVLSGLNPISSAIALPEPPRSPRKPPPQAPAQSASPTQGHTNKQNDPIAGLIENNGVIKKNDPVPSSRDTLIKKNTQILTKLVGNERQRAFELIAAEENDSKPFLTPRPDAMSGGMLIGYSGNAKGRTHITKEQADADLYHQIDKITNLAIGKLGKKNWEKLNPNQKAAIISQAYNAQSIHWSGIKKALDHNNIGEAAAEIAAGPTAQGNPNLINRRQTEAELFAHGDLKTKHIVVPPPDLSVSPRNTGNAIMATKPVTLSPAAREAQAILAVNNVTNNIEMPDDSEPVTYSPSNVDSPYHARQ